MIKQQYLIAGIIIIAIITFFACTKLKNQTSKPDTDTRRPSEKYFPKKKIMNDKIVIIEDIDESDAKKIIQEFCNSYNKETFQVIPVLSKLSDKKFAVTFPYDIQFEFFCYFINYVNYPMGFDRHFKTVGWTTTKPNDTWITDKSVNKKVMLFVSDFDTEYDNVFMTTNDNIGYKLGFAMGEEKQLLNNPEKRYNKQPMTIDELTNKKQTEFK
ncbi:hypothetical protein QW060_26300 [Myroides ceti]|uniref:Lipoprotein n=1 Tax=Paenimyroides ceti TaxID=395087 RepID=A0ABT8CSI2_9FLAO|nr:hypothetical protein [Paenimyroides ceti]MDN3706542.1 hypothetical protein [Paenimyroides ceti]MDN3710304.1 hypothetical protein [Paenimyroides ceti]MDN3710342.1 hypothetical protein [Paenimyroides ceti]